eukprot:15367214-Ditylum_brightwellii.AAC.7
MTSDMMDFNVMSELEPAKDDDMSCGDLSTKNRWEGYTMKMINNVKKDSFGGHWLISCSMYARRLPSRRFCRQEEEYQECIKNPNCLELLKEHVAKNKNVQHIYEEIENRVFKATTDDDSNSSSGSSVSSSAKKVRTFPVRNVKFKKSYSTDGKKRPIDKTNSCKEDKAESTML